MKIDQWSDGLGHELLRTLQFRNNRTIHGNLQAFDRIDRGEPKTARFSMIRPCNVLDSEAIWDIINDGALAYEGKIPADCLKVPYMPMVELLREIEHGVVFWGYEELGELTAVMGIQELSDVTLIRHAYVSSDAQGRGIGSKLLSHFRKLAKKPLLIGTWADATWAIRFYEKHGFHVLPHQQKEQLLRTYWTIPERQIETSVVLASLEWLRARLEH